MRYSTSQRLGHWQRVMLDEMFSRGRVAPHNGRTHRVARSLASRSLCAEDPAKPGTWVLLTPGYAWLISREAEILSTLSFYSDAYARVLERITHLTACARLAQENGRPVNWRGDLA
jgi:hypothetical protein